MGHQIIKCPDGRYNVFSSVVDDWLFAESATREQTTNWFLKKAAERELEQVARIFDALERGEKPYFQFTDTWEEAEATRRSVHGRGKR